MVNIQGLLVNAQELVVNWWGVEQELVVGPAKSLIGLLHYLDRFFTSFERRAV